MASGTFQRVPALETLDYDLFICHASDDKDEVVRPLAILLRKQGRRVWVDEVEIKLGDSLRQKIDDGLARSRFGLVVLSPAFFGKHWPRLELDGLAARENLSGKKVVLPVWHRVGPADVARYSPLLAGRLAARTEDGLAGIVEMIERVFEAPEDVSGMVAPGPEPAEVQEASKATPEPFLVLAPPSQHWLNDPHQVTPRPQVIWAQTAFVNVENVGTDRFCERRERGHSCRPYPERRSRDPRDRRGHGEGAYSSGTRYDTPRRTRREHHRARRAHCGWPAPALLARLRKRPGR